MKEERTRNPNGTAFVIERWAMNLWDDYSEKLDLYDIYLLSMIKLFHFHSEDRCCQIHDDVFAKKLHLDVRSISRRLKKLSDLDLIIRATSTVNSGDKIYRVRKMYLSSKSNAYFIS